MLALWELYLGLCAVGETGARGGVRERNPKGDAMKPPKDGQRTLRGFLCFVATVRIVFRNRFESSEITPGPRTPTELYSGSIRGYNDTRVYVIEELYRDVL